MRLLEEGIRVRLCKGAVLGSRPEIAFPAKETSIRINVRLAGNFPSSFERDLPRDGDAR